MNQDQIKGWWGQVRGRAKMVLGELADDESMRAEGSLDRLAGRLRQAFGNTRRAFRRGFGWRRY